MLLATESHLLEAHQSIWTQTQSGGSLPYWHLPQTEKPPIEQYQRDQFVVTIAQASNFAPETLADMVENLSASYLENSLFQDLSEEHIPAIKSSLMELTPDQIIVSVRDENLSQNIGGCIVTSGQGDRSLIDEIGKPDSHLSTLWALNFLVSPDIAELPITSVVCFSRFYHVMMQADPTYWRAFSQEVLSGMGRVAGKLDARFGILDTHDQAIVHTLSKYYGGKIIDQNPTPTTQVLSHPLSSHYRMKGIVVIGFDTEEQVLLAEEVDSKLGEKKNIWQANLKKSNHT